MPTDFKHGAVLFTKDIGRIARFYEGLLSVVVTHSGAEGNVIQLREDAR